MGFLYEPVVVISVIFFISEAAFGEKAIEFLLEKALKNAVSRNISININHFDVNTASSGYGEM